MEGVLQVDSLLFCALKCQCKEVLYLCRDQSGHGCLEEGGLLQDPMAIYPWGVGKEEWLNVN